MNQESSFQRPFRAALAVAFVCASARVGAQTLEPRPAPVPAAPAPIGGTMDVPGANAGADVVAQAMYLQRIRLAALYASGGAPYAAPSDADRAAWMTHGADVMSVPAEGGVAAYFTQGATVMVPPVPVAAVPDAGFVPPPVAPAPVVAAPDASALLDAAPARTPATPSVTPAASSLADASAGDAEAGIDDASAGIVDATDEELPDGGNEPMSAAGDLVPPASPPQSGGSTTTPGSGTASEGASPHAPIDSRSVGAWFWALTALELAALGFALWLVARLRASFLAKVKARAAQAQASGHPHEQAISTDQAGQ